MNTIVFNIFWDPTTVNFNLTRNACHVNVHGNASILDFGNWIWAVSYKITIKAHLDDANARYRASCNTLRSRAAMISNVIFEAV